MNRDDLDNLDFYLTAGLFWFAVIIGFLTGCKEYNENPRKKMRDREREREIDKFRHYLD